MVFDLSVGDNIDTPTGSETKVDISAGIESINNQTADLKEASVSNQKQEDHQIITPKQKIFLSPKEKTAVKRKA
ncbi:hypothetical protein NQ314_009497 [Rhamnusium bicolor]|uniref:Uncharacterized protein n=1 Tax=Rhamnusium bicolor TaxID=1586634 RepID=A0AAV8Y2E9_9CUCU|nr:hypothetical protein NQ314_009497 [Rhamnusium bicolor]